MNPTDVGLDADKLKIARDAGKQPVYQMEMAGAVDAIAHKSKIVMFEAFIV
jgi:hypothetical protein